MVYLFLWTVLLQVGDGYHSGRLEYGWVNQGEFSRQACPKAAEALSIDAKLYRCVESGR